MKIGVVGDIHHGRNGGETAGEQALSLVQDILASMEKVGVDLVVELGDRINDRDGIEDRRLTAEVGKLFSKLTVPRFHILGNHDTVNLERSEVDCALGYRTQSLVHSCNEWDLVMWSPVIRRNQQGFPFAPDDEIRWLDKTVTGDRQTLLFTHFPLDRQDSKKNWYFQNYPHLATFSNLDEILTVLEAKAGLVATVSGHSHWNSLSTRDDIHFIGLPAVSGTFSTGIADGGWAVIELGSRLAVRVFGQRPRSYELPIRVPGTRWAPPKPI